MSKLLEQSKIESKSTSAMLEYERQMEVARASAPGAATSHGYNLG